MHTKFFTIFLFLSVNSFAQSISEDSKNLARCESVYLYAAHLAQMQNNEGLAKNILFRASRVMTANFFLNESGGRVKGEILEQIKSIRRANKPLLDADPYSVYTKAGECDKSTTSSISAARNMNKIWDGKNFDEWQQMLFNQTTTSMGLK